MLVVVCEIVLIDASLPFAHASIGDLKFLPLQGNRIPFSYDGALIGVPRTCLWLSIPSSLPSVICQCLYSRLCWLGHLLPSANSYCTLTKEIIFQFRSSSSPEVAAASQGPVRGPGEEPEKIRIFLLKDVTFWYPFFQSFF